jgi:hypothetical protein
MTQEDIIRMAREAGGYLAELPNGEAWLFDEEEQIARFAALVAAAEREACACLVENAPPVTVHPQLERATFKDAAYAIRARGQA